MAARASLGSTCSNHDGPSRGGGAVGMTGQRACSRMVGPSIDLRGQVSIVVTAALCHAPKRPTRRIRLRHRNSCDSLTTHITRGGAGVLRRPGGRAPPAGQAAWPGPALGRRVLPILLALLGGQTPVEQWPTQRPQSKRSKRRRTDHAREIAQAETAAGDRPDAGQTRTSAPPGELVVLQWPERARRPRGGCARRGRVGRPARWHRG